MLRQVRRIRDETREMVMAGGMNARSLAVVREEVLVFDNLELDQSRHEVRLDGEPLQLKPKEHELLLFLARHRGMALSRDLILEHVWGWEYDSSSRTVDVHVRWLCEKIEDDPGDARRIITVRGIGYRFEG